MNYYDELGVSRDASEREIRQAYRVLVRLLHPDMQTGEDLRLAAERQSRRLNETLVVLMNADTRRTYDLSLEQELRQRNPGVPPNSMAGVRARPAGVSAVAREASLVAQFALSHWSMILIGAVILSAAALSALLHGNSESVAALQTSDVQPHSPASATRENSALAHRAQPPVRIPVVRKQSAPAFPTGSGSLSARDSNANSLETALPAAITPAILPETLDAESNAELMTDAKETATQVPALARLSPAPASAFSGNWFYTTDLTAPQESAGYRATYVELLLSEKDGALSGDYRARYVIPDRAISPQVEFHLQGRTNSEKKAQVEWSSASGARGAAELSLSAPGIMEFRWWSTELGGQPGLISGTAKLVRQRIP